MVLWELCGIFLLHRQRPALGECLAHLAAAMPVAYLEPALNEFNTFSVYTTKTPRERSSGFSSILSSFPPQQMYDMIRMFLRNCSFE